MMGNDLKEEPASPPSEQDRFQFGCKEFFRGFFGLESSITVAQHEIYNAVEELRAANEDSQVTRHSQALERLNEKYRQMGRLCAMAHYTSPEKARRTMAAMRADIALRLSEASNERGPGCALCGAGEDCSHFVFVIGKTQSFDVGSMGVAVRYTTRKWSFSRLGRMGYLLCRQCQERVYRQAKFVGIYPLIAGAFLAPCAMVALFVLVNKVPLGMRSLGIGLLLLAIAALGIFIWSWSRLLKRLGISKSRESIRALKQTCRDDLERKYGAANMLAVGSMGGKPGSINVFTQREWDQMEGPK